MQLTESPRAEGIRRLYELMLRVNSSTDLSEVLDEIARGVVEVLGYGIAAIARLEGEVFVMTTVAGSEEVREQIIGRRTPVASIFNEFAQADEWGVLRFVPHDRMPDALEESAWVPEFEPDQGPDAWHPLDALYAPLYSATGQLLGNMSVDLPPGNRIPNREERELLEMFVVQAGLAMYNAQQRERLGDQVRMGEMLRSVSSAGQLSSLDVSLREAAQAVGRGLRTEHVWVRCFPSGDMAQVDGTAAWPVDDTEQVTHIIQVLGLLAVRAARLGRPVVVATPTVLDLDTGLTPEQSADLRELVESHRDAALLLTPIGVGREVLGYVLLARDVEQPWTQDEQTAVMEVGRTLGRVVLNARLYDRERQLVGELQELDRYKGELIATISHELKTPLTSIIGHIELLEDLDTGIASVDAISRNADRLNRLVQNLLNYSQLQDRRESVRIPVDLRMLAEQSIDLIAMSAEQGDVAVSLELGDDDAPVMVTADPDELGKVVDNLVGNAVKYTPRGGWVKVRVLQDEHRATVEVSDTGLGISAADQVQLFSAFHRSSNPEALSIPGTGLGLAISRRIAQMHRGEILVSSELGRGSVFRLRLPRLGEDSEVAHTGDAGEHVVQGAGS
ncbi:ATP-binding protein [Nocardioides aequoreus]|uniref:ATP-binding protein n=1 Tax=Nocardioides aequoreus TaxID=397278 RepID=UPI000A06848C|nr:ATP-binding protein [Nocardioides aequoreus]